MVYGSNFKVHLVLRIYTFHVGIEGPGQGSLPVSQHLLGTIESHSAAIGDYQGLRGLIGVPCAQASEHWKRKQTEDLRESLLLRIAVCKVAGSGSVLASRTQRMYTPRPP